jgi:hypothetical protein
LSGSKIPRDWKEKSHENIRVNVTSKKRETMEFSPDGKEPSTLFCLRRQLEGEVKAKQTPKPKAKTSKVRLIDSEDEEDLPPTKRVAVEVPTGAPVGAPVGVSVGVSVGVPPSVGPSVGTPVVAPVPVPVFPSVPIPVVQPHPPRMESNPLVQEVKMLTRLVLEMRKEMRMMATNVQHLVRAEASRQSSSFQKELTQPEVRLHSVVCFWEMSELRLL